MNILLLNPNIRTDITDLMLQVGRAAAAAAAPAGSDRGDAPLSGDRGARRERHERTGDTHNKYGSNVERGQPARERD